MKKLLLFLLACLFVFTSCELEEEGTDYTTLTQAQFDLISPYVMAVVSSDAADTAKDDAEDTAETAYDADGTTTPVTFSGTGYTGSITFTGDSDYTSTMTSTFTDESALDSDNVAFTYSGTMTDEETNVNDIVYNALTYAPESGSWSSSSLSTFDITFTDAGISTLTGTIGMAYTMTAAEMAVMVEGDMPDMTFTGTMTVDGINYKGSEVGAFIIALMTAE